MRKSYELLTIPFNIFLSIGIAFSIYEAIVGGYSDTEFSLLISLFSFYLIITTSYFIWNSRRLNLINKNYSETLDKEMIKSQRLENFRFSFPIGLSNIFIGLFIIGLMIYILIEESLGSFKEIEELLRFFILLIGIFYGSLKINYSLNTLGEIKAKKSQLKASSL